jgi:hypothetical protein
VTSALRPFDFDEERNNYTNYSGKSVTAAQNNSLALGGASENENLRLGHLWKGIVTMAALLTFLRLNGSPRRSRKDLGNFSLLSIVFHEYPARRSSCKGFVRLNLRYFWN